MPWRHPVVRALLFVVVVGVAGMHTLGHHDGHDATTTGSGVHAVMPDHADTDGVSVTPPTGDLDPSRMCLAILTAGALLGLLLASARIGHRVPAGARRSGPVVDRGASRGPPGLVATAPLLARVTVLRI